MEKVLVYGASGDQGIPLVNGLIQKGYKIVDRLVRPALVTVSNGKNTSNKED